MAFRSKSRQLLARYFEEPGAWLLYTLKVPPNAVTLLGLALTGVAAYLAAQSFLLVAGIVFLGASALDMLDGALARKTGQATRFGAVLDSFADRLGEALLILGLLLLYLRQDNNMGVILAFLVLVSSYMVSYLRARGEGLGITMKDSGLGTRAERVVVISVGLITGLVTTALVVVLALSTFTAGQRLFHLWRESRVQ